MTDRVCDSKSKEFVIINLHGVKSEQMKVVCFGLHYKAQNKKESIFR